MTQLWYRFVEDIKMRQFSVSDTPSRYFVETGCTVEGPFLAFLERYGLEICGLPITNRLVEYGLHTQYFQRLALEELLPGEVRVKALGSELLRLRQDHPVIAAERMTSGASDKAFNPPTFALGRLVGQLSQHPTARYPSRPIDQIRHLIIHHTGVPASVGAEVIAGYHVTDLNWPGIGYHFVIDAEGRIQQTNPLTAVSFHARQFNTSGVGIALLGNFTNAVPPTAQLEAAALLCAWLGRELNLSMDAIKGHRELVAVTCPGEQWLQGAAWKYDLLARVRHHQNGGAEVAPTTPSAPESPVAAPEPMSPASPAVVTGAGFAATAATPWWAPPAVAEPAAPVTPTPVAPPPVTVPQNEVTSPAAEVAPAPTTEAVVVSDVAEMATTPDASPDTTTEDEDVPYYPRPRRGKIVF